MLIRVRARFEEFEVRSGKHKCDVRGMKCEVRSGKCETKREYDERCGCVKCVAESVRSEAKRVVESGG